MRISWISSLVLAFVPLSSCTSTETEDPCGLPSSRPDVAAGTLRATRDGNPYTASTGIVGYKLAERSDVTAGDVVLTLAKDFNGNSVRDAVNGGKFPVCILLGDSQGNGNASVNASGSFYLTSSSKTGAVLLVAKDGDDLLGRFAFDAATGSGSTTSLKDGAFRLGPR